MKNTFKHIKHIKRLFVLDHNFQHVNQILKEIFFYVFLLQNWVILKLWTYVASKMFFFILGSYRQSIDLLNLKESKNYCSVFNLRSLAVVCAY